MEDPLRLLRVFCNFLLEQLEQLVDLEVDDDPKAQQAVDRMADGEGQRSGELPGKESDSRDVVVD